MPADVVTCPQCQKNLRLPEELLGKPVKCPTCGHVFTASADLAAPPPPVPAGPLRTSPAEKPAQDDKDRPVRRRRFDDEDDEVAPRRRRRDTVPHRGGMILAFGIVSLTLGYTVVGLVFGILAWVMGSTDMQEIRAGRMDPDGESMTNAGRVCGMIGTLLYGALLLICCPLWVLINIMAR